jgi:chemotaxis protein CheD
MQHTVNISDAKIASKSGDVLVTYSLGSCIGVGLWDPQAMVAGLLHFQLPTGTLDVERSRRQPLMFGDTGLEWLLAQMTAQGASKKRLKVKLAGGAKMFEDNAQFDIGKRNHTSIRKALWQHGLFVDKEEVGGNAARTVFFHVADGKFTLKRQGVSVDL